MVAVLADGAQRLALLVPLAAGRVVASEADFMIRPRATMNALFLEIPEWTVSVSTPPVAFQWNRNRCARLFAVPTVELWLTLCALLAADATERREVVALAIFTEVPVAILLALYASFRARWAVYCVFYCEVCDSPVCEIMELAVELADGRAAAQSPLLRRRTLRMKRGFHVGCRSGAWRDYGHVKLVVRAGRRTTGFDSEHVHLEILHYCAERHRFTERLCYHAKDELGNARVVDDLRG